MRNGYILTTSSYFLVIKVFILRSLGAKAHYVGDANPCLALSIFRIKFIIQYPSTIFIT